MLFASMHPERTELEFFNTAMVHIGEFFSIARTRSLQVRTVASDKRLTSHIMDGSGYGWVRIIDQVYSA